MDKNDFDAERYKSGQQAQWDSVAPGWEKWWHVMEVIAQHVSQELISMAQIASGQCVLDIATGIGEPALAIAKCVGDSGEVIAIDQATQMIAIAKKRASAQGLSNICFQKTDVEKLDFPQRHFDAAVCRWGLMFLPDIEDALSRVHQVLRPKGKFATSVWDIPERIPFYHLALQTLKEMIDVPSPPPNAPTLSGLAGGLLEQKMEKVGFKNIEIKPLTVEFAFSSGQIYAELMKDLAAPLSAMLSKEGPKQQAAYWQRLAEKSREAYGTEDGGVKLPSVSICVVGERE